MGTVKEKIYVEINEFIADLKSDKRYVFKNDPLYIAVVNETEKNLRAWAAAEETPDVAPVVHGHWKYVKRVLSSEWGECSNCDRAHEVTRYCPYCGAKMNESEDIKK